MRDSNPRWSISPRFEKIPYGFDPGIMYPGIKYMVAMPAKEVAGTGVDLAGTRSSDNVVVSRATER
jgi:hypothetical protein